MDLPKVGAFLKELRKAKKLTQEQLAEILNVSRRTVSRWETGTSVPDYDLLVEMADLYQVDLRELLDGEKKSAAASQELVKMKQWITAGLSLMAIFASRVPDGAESLKVNYAGENRLFREALGVYRAANIDSAPEVTVFANADEMEKRLSSEKCKGQGPDVILLRAGDGLDVHELSGSGALCDLSGYMEKDATFARDRYFTPVLDAGKLRGGVYAVPFSFALPSLITSQETLDEIGASDMGDMSFARILDVLKRRALQLSGRDAVLLTAMTRRGDFPYSLYEMSMGPAFGINGEAQSPDETALREISELSCLLCGERTRLKSIGKSYPNDFVNALSRIDFLLEEYQLPVNMRYYDAYYSSGLGRRLRFIPIPDFRKAGSYRAQVMEYGVVTARSRQAQNAYRLLRYIQDYQTEGLFIRIKTQDALEIPVRKDLAMAALEAASRLPGGRAQISGAISVIPPLKAEYAKQIAAWYSAIDAAYIPNRKAKSIFPEMMDAPFAKSKP